MSSLSALASWQEVQFLMCFSELYWARVSKHSHVSYHDFKEEEYFGLGHSIPLESQFPIWISEKNNIIASG